MRIILFAVLLLSLAGWGCYKVFGDEDASVLAFAGESAGSTASDTIKKVADYASSADSNSSAPPVITSHYTFKYRPLPNQDYLNQFLVGTQTSENHTPTRIITDPQTRKVSIIGNADENSKILSVLSQIDSPAAGCHAKAFIVFVRKDQQDSFALGFKMGAFDPSDSFQLSGKTFAGTMGIGSVEASLDLLHARGVVEVVQAPYLALTSGEKSQIVTGEEIAVPIVTINQSVTQTTVEYRKVGLTLDLFPQFLNDEKLRLHIKQTNGIIGQYRDVGGFEVPELTNQVLETTIETRVGQVHVLGGVESSQYTKVKGILSYKREKQDGYLYVVLATYSNIPVAQPVLDSVPAGSSLLPPVGSLGK